MTLNSVSEVTAVENIYFKKRTYYFLNMGNCIGCRCILSFREELKLPLQLYWIYAHTFLSYGAANDLGQINS